MLVQMHQANINEFIWQDYVKRLLERWMMLIKQIIMVLIIGMSLQ